MTMKKTFVALLGVAAVGMSGCNFNVTSHTCCGHKAESSSSASHVPADPNDQVIVKINGAPVVYKKEFLSFAEQAMRANPYLANFGMTSYESAPIQIREQLLDAMVQQRLIGKWGEQEGIAQTSEYQENLKKTVEQVEQMLVVQAFEKRLLESVSVTESDIAAEFRKNKDRFVKEPGSLTVVGAAFKTAQDADQFAREVKKDASSFAERAEKADAQVTQFGALSTDPRMAATSKVTAAMRKVLFSLNDDQSIAQVEDGGSFWVLCVTDRKEQKMFALEEIKPQLEGGIRGEKFRLVRDARLKELRSQFTVDVDKSILEAGQPALPADQEEEEVAEMVEMLNRADEA